MSQVPLGETNMIENRDMELGCAENTDGTLKDASEIVWYNDPDDEEPMSLSARPDTPMDVDRRLAAPTRQAQNMFLDLEAEVTDEDHSGEEDDAVDEEDINFIDDADGAEDSDPKGLHQLSELNEHPMDHFVEELERVYTTGEPLTASSPTVQSADVDRTILETDEGLWEARVPMGEETKIILKLSAKVFQNEALIPRIPKSIFSRISLPGRIFFESNSLNSVRLLCKGIKGINLNKIAKLVDPTQWVEYLTMPHAGYVPKTDTWVRMKKGIHKGDIAFVGLVDPHSLRAVLLYIPRIDYTPRTRKPELAQDKGKGKEMNIEDVSDSAEESESENESESEIENESESESENEGNGGEEDSEKPEKDSEGEDGAEDQPGVEKEHVVEVSTAQNRKRRQRPPARPLDLYKIHENKLRYYSVVRSDIKQYIFRGKRYDTTGLGG
ncbi:hypothetical protein AGABI1DRAFT_133512 [Agaricus bisporus var. burnettii JB137-S8]|uniref:Uncharacterized protein n=1 Tax=Agaricus bisporus var. burnettii (strain JB137-S8 / ATCC MYA-4627 / FGSC 10392) TaxID=597362 RepID=K5WUH3_AGABU|nr:uncharacterized protein AGABI1DRAFT_133512 [Agaricus bisporus var. burnettii JB137-S8]EKM74202.1 hypothetical protein AGABI1DRAFT_133512 [Agaricus bisporus var. burnettii JB137-S8]